MPWQQQGGGGNNGGGPWGSGPSGGGGGPGGVQPPDIEEMLRKGQDQFKQMMPGGIGGKMGILIVVLILTFILAYSSFYKVQPGEVGVRLLFGEYIDPPTPPGGHFWFPAPVGGVESVNVEQTREIAVGFRGTGGNTRTSRTSDVPEESLMLTGDQNIIDIDFVVQWRIKNAKDFKFNIRNPEATVKLASESSIREVVGQTPLEDALAAKRTQVETSTKNLLQQILDSYGAGIFVVDVKMQKVEPPKPVIDAFDDVQRARQDKEREQNEAQAYANDIIPRAKGEASRLIQEAKAYREQLIKEAEGEAKRFLSVYEAYKGNKSVTTRRLYLERMQEVMKDSNKIIIDSSKDGKGVVPYLPLTEIQKRITTPQSGGGN
ncbi:MAG: FtsH protease activity modulator HflK [Rhodospirillaceae bacterium]|nr:FtsH protease activity modulator HflK [Rhodospirillaceae bacterium]|tara:strand:- start:31725 stop:32852 length:1128 start_codon:yes stop_codon:yes gene_type:complete